MFKVIGIISVILLVSASISFVSLTTGSGFITKYATDQSLQVMATALALNVATTSFVVGSFLSIERAAGKAIFNETRRELRHNIIAMAIMFILNFLVVAGINSVPIFGFISKDILSVISTVLTVFFGALVIEVSMLILKPQK